MDGASNWGNCFGTGDGVRRRHPIVFWAAIYAFVFTVSLLCNRSLVASEPSSQANYDPDDAPLVGDGSEADDLDALLDLAEEGVEHLTQINVASPGMAAEVTSVARHASTVGRSPAAVYVITSEMIRRSGARSIPDVLRMAPGVHVARIDASKWAISIRGFNGRFANKLLVQIDGRSVYTPLFGGVWWDVQDLVLADIERIEVIRGPGATVWGANAVNGIINIITKKAVDTQGAYAQAGGGTEERAYVSARYGGQHGEDLHWRVYGKWFERDRGFALADNAQDDWRMGRVGFRADWTPTCDDLVTLQGDWYRGDSGRRNRFPSRVHPPEYVEVKDQDAQVDGGNLMFNWRRDLGDESDWSLRVYYDRTERKWLKSDFSSDRDTYDIDFQHRFPVGYCHNLIWGAAYRISQGRIKNSPPPSGATILPNVRTDDIVSLFVQDEVTLLEDLLSFTIGTKMEWNNYTNFEIQPTARILWTPSPRHSLWASVSRAVRTPTWAEDDMEVNLQPAVVQHPLFPEPIGVFPVGYGSRNYDSEELIAYEGGIRVQQTESLFWDLALFFHQYENLRRIDFDRANMRGNLPIYEIPEVIDNGNRAHTYGFELAFNYDVTPCWKLFGSYSYLQVHGETGSDGGDPRNKLYFQSSWDLGCHWEFDLIWRYVDNFGFADPVGNSIVLPAYHAMDMRLAWLPRPGLEVGVVARNLLDRSHPEFPSDVYLGNGSTEVENEVYGFVTWRY